MIAASAGVRALAWWQLLRGANVFTAASNVVAGFLIVQGAWRPAAALAALVAASMCLYLAGMALNDVFDAKLDAVERPERPLPSGRIALKSAAAVGWALLAGGLALSWLAAAAADQPMPGLIGVLLAFAIVQYDRSLKATWIGPAAMGWCRFLNVLMGASISPALIREGPALGYAALVGVYALALTQTARSETAGPVSRMLRVRNVVTRMIQGFIVIDAIAATIAAGWPSGLAVLALLIPTLALSRWAPMT
ncbi:MAG: hypothetical protein DCC67_12905 [Planctomycetota bacterium]|nr:MAG: hypothetical protein DCC67_12905 [Planctomycetota bacterium]